MAILSPETQKALGPALGLVRVLLALLVGFAIYHFTGGAPIPFLSMATAITLGVIGFFWAINELKKS
jgi:hypothetical protein